MRVIDNPLPKQCRNKHMRHLERKCKAALREMESAAKELVRVQNDMAQLRKAPFMDDIFNELKKSAPSEVAPPGEVSQKAEDYE